MGRKKKRTHGDEKTLDSFDSEEEEEEEQEQTKEEELVDDQIVAKMDDLEHIQHEDEAIRVETEWKAREVLDFYIDKYDLDVTVSLDIANFKRKAGQYKGRSKTIRISKNLLENHPEKAANTIKHELAHAVVRQRHGSYKNGQRVKPHGREWKQAMREMGVDSPNRCHSLQLTDYKYELVCKNDDCDVVSGYHKKCKTVKHAKMGLVTCGRCGSHFEVIENE